MRGRGLKGVVAVLAALALSTGIGSAAANGAAPDAAPALLEQLKAQADGSVTVSTETSTNHAGFVRVARGGDLLPDSASGPQGKAHEFLSEYGAVMGLEGSGSTLVRAATSFDRLGATHVTYNQVYRGVPVFGGTVKAHVDADGSLTSVNGTLVPDINLRTTPKLSQAQAAERAVREVLRDPPRDDHGHASFLTAADLSASAKLYVYRMGLVRGVPGSSQLAYEVEVTNGSNVREFVYVHANAGKVVNRFSGIDHALFRRVFERNHDAGCPPTCPNQVWKEGDPFPGTLNIDQQNIVNFSGHTYNLFFHTFGRDSWDANGAEMRVVNNDPRISCPNANWNGLTTNYCNGVTSDDVVAHEWAHAYTERTHNLIYQWQPGALNEAWSDIWGEVVDSLNGMGTDSPATTRTPGACSQHTVRIPILVINTPPAIAGICAAGAAQFGPPLTEAGLTGNAVLVNDGVGTTTDGCEAPFANAAAISGKIAVIDRGTCTFVVKVKNAQNAGAVGVVVGNNTGTAPCGMGGADPTITIPSLCISLPHRNMIVDQLNAGQTVNVTLRVRGTTTPRENSYRWLLAEDSTAFNAAQPPGGHAIRDMWEPTCLADPGKVSDAEYHCDTSDAGGVHTNSGVPNHGFALIVDGGTYNGHTVAAIGMTKAAHLYYRVQTVYQTRTSDFVDHANALEAACTDLIGEPLNGLTTGTTPVGVSGQTFTAADCAAVREMIAAVEFRRDPTQCNFTTLLEQNPPALCGPDQKSNRIYREGFGSSLRGWTLTNQGVFAGWPNLNWEHSRTLPGGRRGGAAFAPDPDIGNCDEGAGDVSGVMHLTSPSIRIDSSKKATGLRLSFEHYVATEFSFDGGNVSISINGGAFQLIPASAFLFNDYNATLQPTNPLAGQPGFTGTDGGEVFGTWGQSQIDLAKLGVKRNDRIQLRFSFGMDGCAGIDGWYVDDVTISQCKVRKGDDD